MKIRTGWFIPAALAAALLATGSAWAQKPGGILKIQHMDTPPSASIHEEATVSTAVPFMSLYNNLVMYDQHVAKNSFESIVPDLATKWVTSADGKQVVFTLRQGVKWHDGKPFTAKDVACTFELLLVEGKLRRNPRGALFSNVEKVTADSDFAATFHLKERQPSLLALLATGYTPIYPCHIPSADMRRKPIGTGPFKFVELKMNESVKLTKNTDYWKPGRPYLDGIEYTIIADRSTRMLSFASGKFDMTFPTDLTVPLYKNMVRDAPHVQCTMRGTGVSTNLIVNREAPPFDDPKIRRALALTLDRQAFIDILSEGEGKMGGAMLPPPDGVWGMPPEMVKTIIGYDNVAANREKARELMKEAGYGPDKRLKVKVSTRNIATFRDPATILIDHLKHIYVDGELEVIDTSIYYNRVFKKDYVGGAQPHRLGGRRSRRHLLRRLRLRLAAQLQQLLRSGDDQAVRGAVARGRPREAPEDGVGHRPQAAGGRRPTHHHAQPRRRLLAALRQGRGPAQQQHLQRHPLRGRVAG